MALCVLGYNLTRVMNIVGVEKLVEAITGVDMTRRNALIGPMWEPRGCLVRLLTP